MTLGEEVLDALREFGLRYGYFEYEQVQRLRKVETAEDLRSFLDSIGSYNVQESTDARAVTRGLARVDSPSTFLTGCATILFLFFGSFGGGLALSAIVWLLLGSLIGDLPLVQAIAGSIFVPAFFVLFFEIELFIVRVR